MQDRQSTLIMMVHLAVSSSYVCILDPRISASSSSGHLDIQLHVGVYACPAVGDSKVAFFVGRTPLSAMRQRKIFLGVVFSLREEEDGSHAGSYCSLVLSSVWAFNIFLSLSARLLLVPVVRLYLRQENRCPMIPAALRLLSTSEL